MPGYLVHLGASVMCSHGAPAQPISTIPRVLTGGQPIVTQPIPYSIAGCPISPAPICVIGQWVAAATRVFALGQPVVLFDSQSVCSASGAPLRVVTTQIRVTGA